jgi:Sulfotransferase family
MQANKGPAWLGIGAQRSGTTWFTDLLLQHPEVKLAVREKKELHFLDRPNADLEKYRGLFGAYAGEWTPFYLRSPLVPSIAAKVLDENAVVLVLVRDPVERFASAMRHHESQWQQDGMTPKQRHVLSHLMSSDVLWSGMYAAQLDTWAGAVGTDRLLVMQYESVCADPQTYVNLIWHRLGLEPVALQRAEQASSTTSKHVPWTWPDGLREALVGIYEPDARRMPRWGIDLSRWPWFAHLDGSPASPSAPSAPSLPSAPFA